MIAQQVAKKYSSALFELAKEQNLLDAAWDQFNVLVAYLKKDRTFLDFMTAPQVPDEDKFNLVEKAFAGRLEKPFYHFVQFLVERHRLKYLPEIIDEFDRLVRAEKGIARATCITAVKISDAERQELIQRLAARTALKIELEEKNDPSIIGGMIVILHNQILDGSIRYGLNQLRNRLMKVKVH